MLVVSRKQNESIVINNDITITVVELRGDKVRLGVVAPRNASVHRLEVFEAIHGRPGWSPPVGFAAAPPAPAREDRIEVEITLEQLVRQLGTEPTEVNPPVRFNSEGGLAQ